MILEQYNLGTLYVKCSVEADSEAQRLPHLFTVITQKSQNQ